MKILRVINTLNIGGAERSVATNVPYHIQNGFDIDVLLLNGKKTFFKENLQKNGVNVISLGDKTVYNPLLIFKIAKIINKYDIVHVSLFPAFYWVAIAKIITFSNIKLVYTEHSTFNRRRNNIFFKLVDKILYKKYQSIIAISPEANTNLAKHLNFKHKIITINNGVDIKNLIVESSKNENNFDFSEKKVILQIAGFRASKDQDTLIKALTILPEDYLAVFVGNGDRMEFCINLSKELNVYHKILFLGLQSNVGAIIKMADIVVMSSHWEGFGRAAIEGMALGKPVIATNVSGLAEVVGGAGILFEVGDYNELASIIKNLVNDLQLYNSIAQNCKERAMLYDSEKMIKQYEDVYLDLYNESKA
jgi:glycosyltransferase involved in cell wall biosynthesis